MSTGNLRQAAGLDQPGQQLTVAETVRDMLVKNQPRFQALLPKGMTADRFIQIAYTAIRRVPQLLKCSPPSLLGAVTDAARLGLEIGVNGQGYIVPYGAEAQFIAGWRGLVTLVARTGRAVAWTDAVFEGDEFDWMKGSRPFIHHRPAGEDDPLKITHVYACGHVSGTEFPIIEVWPIAKVWKHRDRFNKVGRRHYSFEHPEMYARKVVMLQVLKHLPMSAEAAAAVEMANYEDTGVRSTLGADFTVIPDGEPQAPVVTEHEIPMAEVQTEAHAGEPTVDSMIADVAKASSLPALLKLKDEFKAIFPDATKDEETAFNKACAARMATFSDKGE